MSNSLLFNTTYYNEHNMQILIDWINTIDEPRCLIISSSEELHDGIILLDLLKHILYYLKKENKYDNELLICKIAELSHNQFSFNSRKEFIFEALTSILTNFGKKKELDLLKQIYSIENKDGFVIQLVLLFQKIMDNIKQFFVKNKFKQPNENKINLKIQSNIEVEILNREREKNTQNSNKNLITNKAHPSRMSSKKSQSRTITKQSKRRDSTPTSTEHGRSNLSQKHVSSYMRGIPVKTNLNLIYSDPLMIQLEEEKINFTKFLRPTNPIVDCSLNNKEFIKYTEKSPIYEKSAKYTEIEEKMKEKLNRSAELIPAENIKITKKSIEEKILEWLRGNGLINNKKEIDITSVIKMCKTGVFLADIVNHFENKKVNPIIGIFRESNKPQHIILNLRKTLTFLRSYEKFNSRHLFDIENIAQGDKITIIELLTDIYNHYCRDRNHSRSLSSSNLALNKSISRSINKDLRIKTKDGTPTDIYIRLCNTMKKNRLNKSEQEYINTVKSTQKHFVKKKRISHPSRKCRVKADKLSTQLLQSYTRSNKSADILNKTMFITLDSTNLKSIQNSISPDERKTNLKDYIHYTDKIKSDNKSNSRTANFSKSFVKFKDSLQAVTNFFGEAEINQIKKWLHTLGIKFAFKINFNQKEVTEFKDGLLLIQIISALDSQSKILFQVHDFPKSKAVALINIRKVLQILNKKNQIPSKYLNCEEELYKAEPQFILSFLFMLKKYYRKEKKFNDTLIEKFNMTNKSTRKNSNSKFLSNEEFYISNENQIKANGKDNSKRKYAVMNREQRNLFLMNPKFFWN